MSGRTGCWLWVVGQLLFTMHARTSEGAEPRIRHWLYVPDQIVHLQGWVGYHIDLEFAPGESFVSMSSGDLGALTYGAYANHLVLKPRVVDTRTNLTVFTTQHTYLIDYVVSPGQPEADRGEPVFAWRFSYVPDPQVPAASATSQALSKPVSRYQNTNYGYCGNTLLQPVAASDDGVHTRLRFGVSAEIPAIFVRSDDGTESLLNYSMDGPDVVIHRLARHFILRRGRLVGCVVNQSFIGSGERLESGTTSPQVRRQTREVGP